MTAYLKGPRLVVHILIAAIVNAILLPVFFHWSCGSVLYAFLLSVGFLAAYGWVVIGWVKARRSK